MALRALTPELLAAADRGLRQLYLQAYKAASNTGWDQLITRYPGAGESETYTNLGAASNLRAWAGAREYTTRRVDGLTVLSEEFDAAYGVPLIDIQRDKLGRHTTWIQAAGQKAATFMFPLVRKILTGGTDAKTARCWDGKALFSSSHGVGRGTGQSNIVSGSGADTFDHVATDIEQAVAAGATFKDDQGDYIEAAAYNVAIYPATNYTLGQILRTMQQANQDKGEPDYSGVIRELIPCPDLTGNTWYLAAGGGVERPFGWQEELSPTPETDDDFERREKRFAIHASGAAFPADWTRILMIQNS